MAVDVATLRATLELETSKFRQGTEEAGSALSGLKRIFEVFAGVSLARVFEEAVGKIKQFTEESIKLGFQAKIIESAFQTLAAQIGTNSDALVRSLHAASGEVINQSETVRAAARGLQQGLQPEQITRLMELARSQSQLTGLSVTEAFNMMTESIANQQVRMLRHMGIVINLDKAIEDYSRKLGVSKDALNEVGREQAILSAVLEKTKGKLLDVNTEANQQKEAVEKLSASWTEFKIHLGKTLFEQGFAVLQWAKDLRDTFPSMGAQLTAIQAIWKATGEAAKIALAPVLSILVDSLIPTLKIGAIASAAFGVGLTAGFSVIAGPLAFLSSLVDDLANKRWPSYRKATAEADLATLAAREQLAKAVIAFEKLKDVQLDTSTGINRTNEDVRNASTSWMRMAKTVDAGSNALGNIKEQIQEVPPDIAKSKEAMRSLNAELAKLGSVAEQDQADLDALLKPFREMLVARQISQAFFDAAAKIAGTVMQMKALKAAGESATERVIEAAKKEAAAADERNKVIAEMTMADIALHGTEAEAFETRLRLETDAAEKFAREQITDQRALAETLTFIWKTAADKRALFERQSWDDTAKRIAEAVGQSEKLARSETETVQFELDRQVSILKQQLANQLISQETYDRAVRALETKATEDRLAGYQKEFQANVTQLNLTEDAVRSFYANQQNIRLAAQANEIATLESLAQQYLKWIEMKNNAEQNRAITEAKTLQEEARAHGDFFGFVSGKLDEISAKSKTVWQGIGEVIETTFQAATKTLSDVFFATFIGQTLKAQDIFKGFMDSVLRAISNFMAEAVVRNFLGLLFGGPSFGISTGQGLVPGMLSALGFQGTAAALSAAGSRGGGTGGGGLLGAAGSAAAGLAGRLGLSRISNFFGGAQVPGGLGSVNQLGAEGLGFVPFEEMGTVVGPEVGADLMSKAASGLATGGAGGVSLSSLVSTLGPGLGFSAFTFLMQQLVSSGGFLNPRGPDKPSAQERHDIEVRATSGGLINDLLRAQSLGDIAAAFNQMGGRAYRGPEFLDRATILRELQGPAFDIIGGLGGSFGSIGQSAFVKALLAAAPQQADLFKSLFHPDIVRNAQPGGSIFVEGVGVEGAELARLLNKTVVAPAVQKTFLPDGSIDDWGERLAQDRLLAISGQTGGFVPGIGSGDIVPALLEPGEYVESREEVARRAESTVRGGTPDVLVVKVILDGREVGEATIDFIRRQSLAGRRFLPDAARFAQTRA